MISSVALMALLLQEAPGKITDLGDQIAISHDLSAGGDAAGRDCR
jgi:isocitrate dehydrogenase kinase/phosphatase